MLRGNYIILTRNQFYDFQKEYPFWDTFFIIEEIKDTFNELTGEYITTIYILRKKIRYLSFSSDTIEKHYKIMN